MSRRPLRGRANELMRVLTCPRFGLSQSEMEELLGEYLPWAEVIGPGSGKSGTVPECRDPDDRKFLQLASRAGAVAPVTGDEALLALTGQVEFEILGPAELKARLALHRSPPTEMTRLV